MTKPHSRPLGVTAVAILYLAIAAISLFIAARYVLNPAGNEDMIMLFTRLRIPVTFLNLLAVPPLITAGLATLLFRGLWQEKSWGRVATLFLSFMAMLAALAAIAFIQAFNFGNTRAIWVSVGAFALSALIFIYFLKIDWAAPHHDSPDIQAIPFPAEAKATTTNSPPPAPPPPEPPPIVKPASGMYDSIHSAPTMHAGDAVLKGEATVRLEAESVQSPQPTACLTVISGRDQGRHFEITTSDILIGRHPTLANFVLNDPTISAQHARIRYEDGRFVIQDLDSTNGTFVNKLRVMLQPLQDKDRIKLGVVEMIFSTSCQE